MKLNKSSFFLTILGIALGTSLSAQTQKIGHVNTQEILAMMPEVKTADGDLQKYQSQLEGQLKSMGAEYQAKVQDYQGQEALMADAVKKTKAKEITDLQERIQDFEQTAQESIQKKKEELYSPILRKTEDAVKEVAKENAYSYVLDTASGIVLFSTEATDISSLVKKKLGINPMAPAPSQGAKDPKEMMKK